MNDKSILPEAANVMQEEELAEVSGGAVPARTLQLRELDLSRVSGDLQGASQRLTQLLDRVQLRPVRELPDFAVLMQLEYQ